MPGKDSSQLRNRQNYYIFPRYSSVFSHPRVKVSGYSALHHKTISHPSCRTEVEKVVQANENMNDTKFSPFHEWNKFPLMSPLDSPSLRSDKSHALGLEWTFSPSLTSLWDWWGTSIQMDNWEPHSTRAQGQWNESEREKKKIHFGREKKWIFPLVWRRASETILNKKSHMCEKQEGLQKRTFSPIRIFTVCAQGSSDFELNKVLLIRLFS